MYISVESLSSFVLLLLLPVILNCTRRVLRLYDALYCCKLVHSQLGAPVTPPLRWRVNDPRRLLGGYSGEEYCSGSQ